MVSATGSSNTLIDRRMVSDIFDFVMKKANGIKGLVDMGIDSVPKQCIQPQDQRLDKDSTDEAESIPTIDLSNWDDGVAKSIQEAASKWGFFQVINHGIPLEVLENLKVASHNFFELPADEKIKYYKENAGPTESVLLYWSAIGKNEEDKVLEWRDSLKHGCNPEDDSNLWPPQTREQVLEYHNWAKPLAKKLLVLLLKGLNVEFDESLEPVLMGTTAININYYPPCPDPSLAIGCRRHCDVSCLTILLQDETGGLYVAKENKWIHVTPVKGALAVNIGDSLQIMSNNQYKSVEHCAAVHSSKARISVPLFVNPRLDAVIGPFPQVVQDKPAVYKQLVFSHYWDHFFSNRPSGKASLDFAKI